MIALRVLLWIVCILIGIVGFVAFGFFAIMEFLIVWATRRHTYSAEELLLEDRKVSAVWISFSGFMAGIAGYFNGWHIIGFYLSLIGCYYMVMVALFPIFGFFGGWYLIMPLSLLLFGMIVEGVLTSIADVRLVFFTDRYKALLRLMKDSYEFSRYMPESTLRYLRVLDVLRKNRSMLGAQHVPELIHILSNTKDERSDVHSPRLFAAAYLGNLGESAKTAIPALIETLTDNNKELREVSIEALGKIGLGAQHVPQLIDILRKTKDKPSDVHNGRLYAVTQLGDLGESSKAAIPSLIENLTDGSEELREVSIEALRKIGANAATALKNCIHDDSIKVRKAAIEALRKIQEKPKTVVRGSTDSKTEEKVAPISSDKNNIEEYKVVKRFCTHWNEPIELKDVKGSPYAVCITHGEQPKCTEAHCKYSLAGTIAADIFGPVSPGFPDYTRPLK